MKPIDLCCSHPDCIEDAVRGEYCDEHAPVFAPNPEVADEISAAYMRGFESGVKGEPTPDHKVKGGAFERGWIVGAIARKRELETAALYARLVLDSPAMAQARANAGDEPVAPAPLPKGDG